MAIVRQQGQLQHGQKSAIQDFKTVMNTVKKRNATTDATLAYIRQNIGVDDYLKHTIINVFVGNSDAGSNIRWCKEIKKNAKWKPILFDLDMGFGIFGKDEYKENSLDFFTSNKEKNVNYPTESTLLIRQIRQYDILRHQYISLFFDALNTVFTSQHMDSTLTSLLARTQDEMEHHRKRWNISSLRYKRRLYRLRNFIENRPIVMCQQLYEHFDLSDSTTLEITVPKGGKVYFN